MFETSIGDSDDIVFSHDSRQQFSTLAKHFDTNDIIVTANANNNESRYPQENVYKWRSVRVRQFETEWCSHKSAEGRE